MRPLVLFTMAACSVIVLAAPELAADEPQRARGRSAAVVTSPAHRGLVPKEPADRPIGPRRGGHARLPARDPRRVVRHGVRPRFLEPSTRAGPRHLIRVESPQPAVAARPRPQARDGSSVQAMRTRRKQPPVAAAVADRSLNAPGLGVLAARRLVVV